MCYNLDFALTLLSDLDGVTQVTGAALDLDAIMEELLEGVDVEDLVLNWLRGVDHKLGSLSA